MSAIDVGAALTSAYRFCVSHKKSIAALCLLQLILKLPIESLYSNGWQWLPGFIAFITLPIFSGSTIVLTAEADALGGMAVRKSFKRALGLYSDFMAFQLLLIIILLVPALAISLIPYVISLVAVKLSAGIFLWAAGVSWWIAGLGGIIIVTWLVLRISLAPFFIVIDDDRPIVAMRRSSELTTKDLWPLLACALIVGLPAFLISLAISMVLSRFGMAGMMITGFVSSALFFPLTSVFHQAYLQLSARQGLSGPG